MTLGIGLIGSGNMARVHVLAIGRATGARAVAVTGGSRAGAFAAEFGLAHEPSVTGLLARPDVDAVVIATPHTTHVPLSRAAAAAGRHVFLEKPMAVTTAACDAIVDACAAAGVRLMVAHITRFVEASRVAYRAVQDGAIGELRMAQVWRLIPGYDAGGWALDPDEGSAFLDWGSHGCDIVRWFMGTEPELAFGRFTSYRGGAPAALSGMAEFTFPGARVATIWQSYEIPANQLIGTRARYLLVGSEGVLDLQAYGEVTLERTGEAPRTLFRDPEYPGPGAPAAMHGAYFNAGFRDQMQAFIDAIVDHREPAVTGADGRAAVAMVEAAERSSTLGTAIRCAEVG